MYDEVNSSDMESKPPAFASPIMPFASKTQAGILCLIDAFIVINDLWFVQPIAQPEHHYVLCLRQGDEVGLAIPDINCMTAPTLQPLRE